MPGAIRHLVAIWVLHGRCSKTWLSSESKYLYLLIFVVFVFEGCTQSIEDLLGKVATIWEARVTHNNSNS